MRDALAERLLARVMGWTERDVAEHRPVLQALALLKYDEYQQFAPGMRFVESLAYWLEQFPPDKRPKAYEFVRRRLIFFSESEMAHFASILFADFIRPILLEHVAGLAGVPPWRPREVLGSEAYRDLQRRVVVLGLSDGARIDQFRRATTALRHDQIFGSYDLSPERLGELRAFLAGSQGARQTASALVLLDDFAGSGSSYVREESGEPKGKVARFLQRVQTDEGWRSLVSFPETLVVVALYVATAQAERYLREQLDRIAPAGTQVRLCVVQPLPADLRISPGVDPALDDLVESFYDPAAETDSSRKGGTDLKYGYAACGLPLILHHNTPNNSLYLLWAEGSEKVRPLFERINRHRGDP